MPNIVESRTSHSPIESPNAKLKAAADADLTDRKIFSGHIGDCLYRGITSRQLDAAYLRSAGPRQPYVWVSRMRPLPQPPTKSLADTSGNVMVGSGGAIPAVTNGRGSGLRKAPTAWHSVQAGTVKPSSISGSGCETSRPSASKSVNGDLLQNRPLRNSNRATEDQQIEKREPCETARSPRPALGSLHPIACRMRQRLLVFVDPSPIAHVDIAAAERAFSEVVGLARWPTDGYRAEMDLASSDRKTPPARAGLSHIV
jgi:hypothetical protein